MDCEPSNARSLSSEVQVGLLKIASYPRSGKIVVNARAASALRYTHIYGYASLIFRTPS